MKKRVKLLSIATLLVLVITTLIAPAAQADVPPEEEWVFAGSNYPQGSITCSFIVNTISLQITMLRLVNTLPTGLPPGIRKVGRLVIFDGKKEITEVELFAYPGETVELLTNDYKLHRLPLTDPDDPDSIRYPKDIYFGGASWNY